MGAFCKIVGGVLSPLLANVYLHYVLDAWFKREVQPQLQGRAFLIRYGDDFIIGFAREQDARRVLDVLPKRFGKYGLTLHPDKTRLVAFRPPSSTCGVGSGAGSQPGTFDLLGFTHYWGRSRRGNWAVKRRTAASRFRRAIRTVAQWCRLHRHLSIPEQHRTLGQKLRGHCAYFGITGNGEALRRFRDAVQPTWQKWLSRRSWAGGLSWDAFNALRKRYPLPPALVVHSVCRP
jgi:hypothetical protein